MDPKVLNSNNPGKLHSFLEKIIRKILVNEATGKRFNKSNLGADAAATTK